MKQAEPVEHREKSAERTKYPAPRAIDEQRGGKERNQNAGFQSAHNPAVSGHETLDGIRQSGFKRARRTQSADGNSLLVEGNAFGAENHWQKKHQTNQHDVTEIASPCRQ